MLGIIATLQIQDGKADEFVAGFKQLQAGVLANEPGCKLYALHRSDDPNTFIVMERYDDEAAFKAHGKSAHMAAAAPVFASCLAARPELQILQEV